FKPIFDSLSEAALRGARHADAKLPQLARNHSDQLDDWVKKIRGEDRFDGKPDTPTKPDPHKPQDGTLIPRPECLDANGDIDWSKAPNDGFTHDAAGNPIKTDHVPAAGDRFDRFGDPGGRFVSPIPEDGPFSYGSRSLPYHENPNAYHQYEWRHSPADVESVYNQLDDQTRQAVDDVLEKYDLELSDLSHVTRGEAAAIPSWGTPGGATQDLLPVSVDLLDKMGMIREVR
ncbi:glycohydrolase toxin TNT-related protein, partial [Microbacterium sp.]|uniref:glycohydrolase toxin TNT-related protein n=1 Tax=Microbacterium sp. TaxID=51671 RepID=UPI0028114F62